MCKNLSFDVYMSPHQEDRGSAMFEGSYHLQDRPSLVSWCLMSLEDAASIRQLCDLHVSCEEAKVSLHRSEKGMGVRTRRGSLLMEHDPLRSSRNAVMTLIEGR